MKRSFFHIYFFFFFLSLLCSEKIYAKNEFTFTNIAGGNQDTISSKDFFDSNFVTSIGFTFADRLQLDLAGDNFSGRVRLTALPYYANGTYSDLVLKGYGYFYPVKNFGFAFGNSFFNKFGMDEFYYASEDDYPDYGKFFKNGLGIIGSVPLPDLFSVPVSMKLSAGIDIGSDNHPVTAIGFNAAWEFMFGKLFGIGGTVSNIAEKDPVSVAVGIGFFGVDRLKLNAGYVYNMSETDFLPKKAKDVIFLSGGYSFKKLDFSVYADFMTSVNDKYVSGKDRVEIRGYAPYAFSGRFDYVGFSDMTLTLKFRMSSYIGRKNQGTYEIFPSVEYKINKNMTLDGGLRITLRENFKATPDFVIPEMINPNISIPVTFRFKYGN